MYSLLFLICFSPAECISVAFEPVFSNQQDCEIVAQTLIANNQQVVRDGFMPPHNATYQCINWGETA